MYESPHRIADTLRGLLLADSATAAAGVGLNQREGWEEEEDGGRRGSALVTEGGGGRGRGEGGGGGGREGRAAATDVAVDASAGRRWEIRRECL